MIKKIILGLLGVLILLLVFLARSNSAQSFNSRVEVLAFDQSIRFLFHLDDTDRQIYRQIGRNFGELGLSEELHLSASPSLVDLVQRTNLSPIFLRFAAPKTKTSCCMSVTFKGEGNFADAHGSSLEYVDSESELVLSGDAFMQSTVASHPLLRPLQKPTLSVTYWDKQQVLLISGRITDQRQFDDAVADLKRKKASEEEKDAVFYTESDVDGKRISSFSLRDGFNVNMYRNDDLVLVSTNAKYLERLMGKTVSTNLTADPEFKSSQKKLAKSGDSVDLLYVNYGKVAQNGQMSFVSLVYPLFDLQLTSEVAKSVDLQNLRTILVQWNNTDIEGTVTIK